MAVYRPQYKDKKTGEMKRTAVYYYKFIFAGRLIKESAKSKSKTVAKEAEKRRRRELETGFNGLSDSRDDRIQSLRELGKAFLKDYRVRQPRSFPLPNTRSSMLIDCSVISSSSTSRTRLSERIKPTASAKKQPQKPSTRRSDFYFDYCLLPKRARSEPNSGSRRS